MHELLIVTGILCPVAVLKNISRKLHVRDRTHDDDDNNRDHFDYFSIKAYVIGNVLSTHVIGFNEDLTRNIFPFYIIICISCLLF